MEISHKGDRNMNDKYYFKHSLIWGIMFVFVTIWLTYNPITIGSVIRCGLAYAVIFYNIKNLLTELKEDIKESKVEQSEPEHSSWLYDYHDHFDNNEITLYKDGWIYIYDENGYLIKTKKLNNADDSKEFDPSLTSIYCIPDHLRYMGYHIVQYGSSVLLVSDKDRKIYVWTAENGGTWVQLCDETNVADFRSIINDGYYSGLHNTSIYNVDGANSSQGGAGFGGTGGSGSKYCSVQQPIYYWHYERKEEDTKENEE